MVGIKDHLVVFVIQPLKTCFGYTEKPGNWWSKKPNCKWVKRLAVQRTTTSHGTMIGFFGPKHRGSYTFTTPNKNEGIMTSQKKLYVWTRSSGSSSWPIWKLISAGLLGLLQGYPPEAGTQKEGSLFQPSLSGCYDSFREDSYLNKLE